MECFKKAKESYECQQEKRSRQGNKLKELGEICTFGGSNIDEKYKSVFPSAYNNLRYVYMRHNLNQDKNEIKGLFENACKILKYRLKEEPGVSMIRIVKSQAHFNLGYWYAIHADEINKGELNKYISYSISEFGESIDCLNEILKVNKEEESDPYIAVTIANTYRHRGFMYVKVSKEKFISDLEKASDDNSDLKKAFDDFGKAINQTF